MATGRDPIDPKDAFALLSDETRVAILHAVWDATETPIAFSAIREEVGGPDSGHFNYHIDQLRGHYLDRTDGGYDLTQAGREVVRAVLAGTLTEQPEVEPASIDAECTDCGQGLVARYDEYGHVECPDCGVTVMWNEFPPAGLEGRDAAELARALDRWTQRRFHLAMDGVCPSCAAPVETTRAGPPELDGEDIASLHRCSNCRYEARVPLFGHVLEHPALISFLYDRGIDITTQPFWRLREIARNFEQTVLTEEPWRVALEVRAEGESLVLRLDERFDVIDVELTTG